MTTSTTLFCGVCQKPVIRAPAQSENKHGLVFCSRKCQYAARGVGLTPRIVDKPYQVTTAGLAAQSMNIRNTNAKRKAAGLYACSAATRAKISISISKLISNGKFPRVSKLEDTVAGILDTMSVTYERQKHFREPNGQYGAVADFYLPVTNTVLEVNGSFWHVDPRVFPNGPTHASQRRTLSKYARKMGLLAAQGIPVIEVWEQDLKADPHGSVQKALTS